MNQEALKKEKKQKDKCERSQKCAAILLTVLALTAIFATAKDLSLFVSLNAFDHGAVRASMVLNDKTFFKDELRQTKSVVIIAVDSENHKSSCIGTATMSIQNDNEKLHTIKIPKILCFLLSPVNVAGVGRLSLNFGDGICIGYEHTCHQVNL